MKEHNVTDLTCKAAMRYGASDIGVLSFDRLSSAVNDKNLMYLTRAYSESREKQIISYPNFKINKNNMYYFANMNCKVLEMAGNIDLSREDLLKFLFVLSKSNFNIVRFSHESSSRICEMLNIKKITIEELLELGKKAVSEYESFCDSMSDLPPKIKSKDWKDSIISHAIVDYFVDLNVLRFDGSFHGSRLLTNLGHCDVINDMIIRIILNDSNVDLGWVNKTSGKSAGAQGHINIDYRIVDLLMSYNPPDMETSEGRKEAKSRIDCFIAMLKNHIGIEKVIKQNESEVDGDCEAINKFKETHRFCGDFDSIFLEKKIIVSVRYTMEGESFLGGEPIDASVVEKSPSDLYTDEHNTYSNNMVEIYTKANGEFGGSTRNLMTNKVARKRLINRINKYRYLNNTLFEACKMLSVDIAQAIKLSPVYRTESSLYNCTDPNSHCVFSCKVDRVDICTLEEADMYMSACTGSFLMASDNIRVLPTVDMNEFTPIDSFGNIATKPYPTGPFPFETFRGSNIIITNVDPTKVAKGSIFTLINRLRHNRLLKDFIYPKLSVISFCEFTEIPDYIFEDFFKAMCGMVTESGVDRIQSTDDEARGISTFKQASDDISVAIVIPSSCYISPRWGNNLIHLRKGISKCTSTADYIAMGANHIEISSSGLAETSYFNEVKPYVYTGCYLDVKSMKVLLGHDKDGVPVYYSEENPGTAAAERRAKLLSSIKVTEDKNIKINEDIKIGRRKSSVGRDVISITVNGLHAKDISSRISVLKQIKEMTEMGHMILTGV